MKNYSQRLKYTLVVVFSLFTNITNLIVCTQPTLSQSSTPRPKVGRPSRQAQGGSRGGCPTVKLPLTALVPLTEAKTQAQHPTFWFYVPYIQGTAPAEFTVRDSEGNLIGSQSVLLPPVPSVIGVRLPSTIALEPDKSYRWFFNLYCTGREQPPISVEGSVQRVRASKTQLSNQDARQAVAQDIANDMWLDALTSLTELRLRSPQDEALIQEWKRLLTQFEFEPSQLDEITASPLSPA
jgi:hypothetical protein